jgi:hypothetical protein
MVEICILAFLSAKLVLTFEDRGCHVVSVTDPYGRNLRFLDRSSYFFFRVAPQLDRLCGLVVRVLGYRSGSPGSIPDTTRKKK